MQFSMFDVGVELYFRFVSDCSEVLWTLSSNPSIISSLLYVCAKQQLTDWPIRVNIMYACPQFEINKI